MIEAGARGSPVDPRTFNFSEIGIVIGGIVAFCVLSGLVVSFIRSRRREAASRHRRSVGVEQLRIDFAKHGPLGFVVANRRAPKFHWVSSRRFWALFTATVIMSCAVI